VFEREFAMHFKLKLIQIGNSVGVTLPKEVLAAMKVDKGDTITMTPAPDGFRVTPYDADIKNQMEVMRQVMKKRRNALRELAK
jgi:putative addiction module antidote